MVYKNDELSFSGRNYDDEGDRPSPTSHDLFSIYNNLYYYVYGKY